MTKLSHLEINVSDYSKSIRFYDTILLPLGWKRLVCSKDCTTYSDGVMKLILSPTEEKYRKDGFHRKRVGLNHLAFNANSADEVNKFHNNVLVKNSIDCLYEQGPSGDNTYYALYFEDPDRMKIEVVYAPEYCEHHHWTNQIENDFDPNATIRVDLIIGIDAAPLVDTFYEQEGKTHRARPSDLFFVAFKENNVVGVCRFCIEENTPLLRSMVVHEPLRSKKIGANILKTFAHYLDQNNFGPTYCIPYTHLDNFYGLINFKIIKNEESPAFLQDRIKQYHSNNPETFMIMRRD